MVSHLSTEAEVVSIPNLKPFTPGRLSGGTVSAALDNFLARYLQEPVNKVPTPWSTASFSFRDIHDLSAMEAEENVQESEEESEEEYIEESVLVEEGNLYYEDDLKAQAMPPVVELTPQDQGEIMSFLSDIFGFPSNQPVGNEANLILPSFPPVPTPTFAPQSRRGATWDSYEHHMGEVQIQQGGQAEKQIHECAFSVIKACSLVATIPDSAPFEKCSICLESMAVGQRARILPCLHRLHECCAGRYFRAAGIKPACPVCRYVA